MSEMNAMKKAKKMNKKMNECKGGCSNIMGGTESKKKKKRRRRAWACFQTGYGPVRPIRVVNPLFPHFSFSFSLLSSLSLSNSLFSLLSSPARKVAGGSGGRRRRRGGRPSQTAAPPLQPFFLKFFLFLYILTSLSHF